MPVANTYRDSLQSGPGETCTVAGLDLECSSECCDGKKCTVWRLKFTGTPTMVQLTVQPCSGSLSLRLFQN